MGPYLAQQLSHQMARLTLLTRCSKQQDSLQLLSRTMKSISPCARTRYRTPWHF